jgi:hypothetical protein
MDRLEWDGQRRPRRRELKLGALTRGAFASSRWWIGLSLVLFACAASLYWLEAPTYRAEAQISFGLHSAGLAGWRQAAAVLRRGDGCGTLAGETALITSRGLARQAIEDLGLKSNPEFEITKEAGPVRRALVHFGLTEDPARKGEEERLLEFFLSRLSVGQSGKGGLLTIAFASEDPLFAARAANKAAALYLAMLASAAEAGPCAAKARVIVPAAPPQAASREDLLTLAGAVMLFLGLVSMALPLLRFFRRGQREGSAGPALGCFAGEDAGTTKPGAEEMAFWPREDQQVPAVPAQNGSALPEVVARLSSFSSAVERGIRVLAASLEASGPAESLLFDLARALAAKGHTLAIGLNPDALLPFGSCTGPGLGELLSGEASFGDVICRDPASRLHLLPLGRNGRFGLDAFEYVLDALSATYGFILMIAPPLEESETAAIVAELSDCAVLAGPPAAHARANSARRYLVENGAREPLMIVATADENPSAGKEKHAA